MNTPAKNKNTPDVTPNTPPSNKHNVCKECGQVSRPMGLVADPIFPYHLYGSPFMDMGLREELEDLDKRARRLLARRLEILETIERWERKQ